MLLLYAKFQLEIRIFIFSAFPIGNCRGPPQDLEKMKIRILGWNFAYSKGTMRVVYGENFTSFGCTLTEIGLSKRLDRSFISRLVQKTFPIRIQNNKLLKMLLDSV